MMKRESPKVMDRHHAIRIAVRGLSGDARTRAIDRLLKNPERIQTALAEQLRGSSAGRKITANRLGGTRKAKRLGRNMLQNIRFTPEEWIALRDEAAKQDCSIAEIVRRRCFRNLTSQIQDN